MRRRRAWQLYVEDGIYDRFVQRVVKEAGALRQGPPHHDAGQEVRFDVGALTVPRQLDIVDRQVKDAVKKGARVLCGGRPRPELGGQFYAPTVLVDVDHTMDITRQETFGPVLMTILRFSGDDEAVQLANDSAYGLGSSVFSKSRARAEGIARRLSAGMTVIND